MHRTVTELFVRDIDLCKFLDFKSIHEHDDEHYIDICLCLLTRAVRRLVWSFDGIVQN